jgi:hypothetical protein
LKIGAAFFIAGVERAPSPAAVDVDFDFLTETKMPNPGRNIRHPKARGEWAEMRFMTRAAELCLYVSKPWGESAPYDFIVDHHGHFLRVQVKCTIYCRGNSYKCHLDTNGVPYDPRDLDLFAAYVIPTNTWYLLPIRATNRQPDILLTPHNPKSKYSRYHEAWHLLMGPSRHKPTHH